MNCPSCYEGMIEVKKNELWKCDCGARLKQLTFDECLDVVPYKEVIDYLNECSGKSYRSTSHKTRSLIKARFNEGYSLSDFKKVIDVKVREWMKDEKMKPYIRPETLFSNKFESYLNQDIGVGVREIDKGNHGEGFIIGYDE